MKKNLQSGWNTVCRNICVSLYSKAVFGLSRFDLRVLCAYFFVNLLFSPVSAYPRNIYVPKDYPKVQEALNAAAEGDTIWIAPGKYVGGFVVSKDVVIFGAGADKCTVTPLPNSPYPVVFINKNSSIIDGLTVDNSGGAALAGVVINGGSPRLTRMKVKGGSKDGIIVNGSGYSDVPILKFSEIFANKGNGLFVVKTAMLVGGNKIYNNGSSGISLRDSSAKLENNKIYENKEVGIIVKQNVAGNGAEKSMPVMSHASILRNDIYLNKGGGIVCDRSSPFIKENKVVVKVGKPNILLFSSSAFIKGNELTSSGPPAIMIMPGSFPKIISNTIKGTLRFAVMGEVKNAQVKDNKVISNWKTRMDFLPKE